ncbi:MAG: universal stress protein [Acidobacteriaceae bacterium]
MPHAPTPAEQVPVRLKRILFATDFSPESNRALEYAYAMANAYEAELYVLHVAENIRREPLSTKMTADAFCRMRLLQNCLPENEQGVQPRFLVDFGPAEPLILEVAQKRAVQVIVVSAPATTHPICLPICPGPWRTTWPRTHIALFSEFGAHLGRHKHFWTSMSASSVCREQYRQS